MVLNDATLLFDFIIGFLALVFLSAGITMFVLWRRRKLTFTNFLGKTGRWEKEGWQPGQLHDNFTYDKQLYTFDIRKCTRDLLNRPIAHYYKGNPSQIEFDVSQAEKSVRIQSKELTSKDWVILMTTKVLRDIFEDEEVMNMLWMILIGIGLSLIVTIIVVATHNPPVTLKQDNGTISYFTKVCADACRQTLIKPVQPLNVVQPVVIS